ncbi:hypothetical protein BDV23DRAFT_177127 [Aspergillus alliaceus]|uniref:F-box domain-containing protein n=1 Tax=Petromyces alliaceus TaxID=209559 RepID=A0A5N7BRB1_PETAA|nr:hypothetical protein BDV23DRAFT_177127 [Aspergillus alliaceus]
MRFKYQLSHIKLLPVKILYILLSLVSKYLRQVCLPSLFQKIKFKFSATRLDKLQCILRADIYQHVISVTYNVPELLKPEIMDFKQFKSNILTPEDYVEEANEIYEIGYPADTCPLYIVIYDTLCHIYNEQRDIIEKGADTALLSVTLRQLPRLSALHLYFCENLAEESWVESYLALDMTIKEKTYKHHVRVVSDALRAAKDRGSCLQAIHLSGLQLPFYRPWDVIPDTCSLVEALEGLLMHIPTVRLTEAGSVLELLSHALLGLHQLELCRGTVRQASLQDFLQMNIQSVKSLGFHDISLFDSDLLGQLVKLSPQLLCNMLATPATFMNHNLHL